MRAPVKSPYNTKMVTLVFGSFRYFSLCYYNYYFDFYIYSDASSPQIFNIMLEAVRRFNVFIKTLALTSFYLIIELIIRLD